MFHRKDGQNMVRGNISVEDQLLTSLQFDSRNPRFHSKQQSDKLQKRLALSFPFLIATSNHRALLAKLHLVKSFKQTNQSAL
jgi:hypothetical protein